LQSISLIKLPPKESFWRKIFFNFRQRMLNGGFFGTPYKKFTDAFMVRQHYILLAVAPQKVVSQQRKRFIQIVFGVLIGFLLACSLTFESESVAENVLRSTIGRILCENFRFNINSNF
jgi:hypothetical protein